MMEQEKEPLPPAAREVPEGYAVITEGKVQSDDLVFNWSYCEWTEADKAKAVNDDVDAYYVVVRKV